MSSIEIASGRAIRVFDEVRVMVQRTLLSVSRFVLASKTERIARQHIESSAITRSGLGFNIFSLLSDLFYRETFHTDLLHGFLDPRSSHGEGEKYLKLFLCYISSRPNGHRIDTLNYKNATLTKEKGRIDLMILDHDSKRAIIIENKINNAPDQERQLPRYLLHVENSLRYTCDGIIYLRLDQTELPDQRNWTPQERSDVNSLLIPVNAYDRSGTDLLTGWLTLAIKESESADTKVILEHYSKLLAHLGSNAMNKLLMKEFYDFVLQDDNLPVAIALQEMLENLARYRAERIIDEFKHDLSPFGSVQNWQFRSAYFDHVPFEGADLALDVWMNPDESVLEFWDRKDPDHLVGTAGRLLELMGLMPFFRKDGRGFKKQIPFPADEPKLFDEIRAFKSHLAKVITF